MGQGEEKKGDGEDEEGPRVYGWGEGDICVTFVARGLEDLRVALATSFPNPPEDPADAAAAEEKEKVEKTNDKAPAADVPRAAPPPPVPPKARTSEKPRSSAPTITIRVRYTSGEETFFKVKKTTRFEKVFKTYAGRFIRTWWFT